MDAVLREILKWAVLSAIISVVLFITQYTIYSPWWRDRVGRSFVLKDIAIVLSLLPLAGAFFFHLTISESRVAGWVYVLSIIMVTAIMLNRMVIWYQERKKEDSSWEDPVIRWLKKTARRLRTRRNAPE